MFSVMRNVPKCVLHVRLLLKLGQMSGSLQLHVCYLPCASTVLCTLQFDLLLQYISVRLLSVVLIIKELYNTFTSGIL